MCSTRAVRTLIYSDVCVRAHISRPRAHLSRPASSSISVTGSVDDAARPDELDKGVCPGSIARLHLRTHTRFCLHARFMHADCARSRDVLSPASQCNAPEFARLCTCSCFFTRALCLPQTLGFRVDALHTPSEHKTAFDSELFRMSSIPRSHIHAHAHAGFAGVICRIRPHQMRASP